MNISVSYVAPERFVLVVIRGVKGHIKVPPVPVGSYNGSEGAH
jgi:hypothetical protein